MKEEIIKALTIIEEEEGRVKRDIEIIHKAKEEIERLNNIIDKAIEYIENHSICYCPGENEHYEFDYITTSPKELLNILEGEDKE